VASEGLTTVKMALLETGRWCRGLHRLAGGCSLPSLASAVPPGSRPPPDPVRRTPRRDREPAESRVWAASYCRRRAGVYPRPCNPLGWGARGSGGIWRGVRIRGGRQAAGRGAAGAASVSNQRHGQRQQSAAGQRSATATTTGSGSGWGGCSAEASIALTPAPPCAISL